MVLLDQEDLYHFLEVQEEHLSTSNDLKTIRAHNGCNLFI